MFADEKYLSPSITAVLTEEFDAEEFRKSIKDKFDILLAGGQDHLKGKIFRVGHLGYVNDRDIITAIAAISQLLLLKKKISLFVDSDKVFGLYVINQVLKFLYPCKL